MPCCWIGCLWDDYMFVDCSSFYVLLRSYNNRNEEAEFVPLISELDDAATKLQKVYKSYRTRRSLADNAVVAEELWWKSLDFAALDRSSISFSESDKLETAVSARSRVAKVGKGLSKDEKAQKLAIQHWLEAVDPRHRYGHNLYLYYDIWSESKSSQPFFYWLDIGDGKELNLEKCSRNNLQRQCIRYLEPTEREAYEVIVENGRLIYKQTGVPLNTVEDSKWLYVLSASKALYVGQKKKGLFHHSSFLSGGATKATGRLEARQGVLEAIWPYSLPTKESFKEFIAFLEDHNVDLTNVKTFPIDDDEDDDENLMETKQEDTKVANGSIQGESIHEQGSDAGNAKASTFNLAKHLSCKWKLRSNPFTTT